MELSWQCGIYIFIQQELQRVTWLLVIIRIIKYNLFMINLPLIVLAAPTCSGKTEVLRHMRRNHFVGVDMGVFIKETLDLSNYVKQYSGLTLIERIELHGRELLMSQLVNSLLATPKSPIKGYVVSGMRSNIDMELLQRYTKKKSINVFIHSDMLQRYTWSINRKRDDAPKTFLDFIRVDYEEIASGMNGLLNRFDFDIIYNNSTLEHLFREIERRILV